MNLIILGNKLSILCMATYHNYEPVVYGQNPLNFVQILNL